MHTNISIIIASAAFTLLSRDALKQIVATGASSSIQMFSCRVFL